MRQLNEKQLEFMKELVPDVDMTRPLSDNDYYKAFDAVSDKLLMDGFKPGTDYVPNNIGNMCEDIITWFSKEYP